MRRGAPLRQDARKSPLRRSPLRQASTKRQKELRTYGKLRKAFLEAHPACQVVVNLRSVDVHHKAGRVGSLLNDTRYWLAVSREAHEKIHQNPRWARERGYIIDRPIAGA